MSEQKIPIPAMLYNAAVGGHVTNSQQIIDENLNREQNDINQETVGAVLYNSTTPNGMGRIVLKKNDNFKQVVEAQTNGNTIFVIKYDFILTGDVTVPANCVFEFDGGSINGAYTITGTDTQIFAPLVKIFNTNINLAGTWNIEGHIRWFGAKPENEDNAVYIQKALDSFLVVRFDAYIYKTSPLVMSKAYTIKGDDTRMEGCWISFILNSGETGLTFTNIGGGGSFKYIKYITFYAQNAPSSSEEIPYQANVIGIDGQNASLVMEYCTVRSFQYGIKGATNSWDNRFINCAFSYSDIALYHFTYNYLIVEKCTTSKINTLIRLEKQEYISERPNAQIAGEIIIKDCIIEGTQGNIFYAEGHTYTTLILQNNYFEFYTGRVIAGGFKHIRDINNFYYLGGIVDRLATPWRPISIISIGNKVYVKQNATTKPFKCIYECMPKYSPDSDDTDDIATVVSVGNQIKFEDFFSYNQFIFGQLDNYNTVFIGTGYYGTDVVQPIDYYSDYRSYGDTAHRPAFNAYTIKGRSYFDTTLNMPIYWNGTKWIKADGTDA